MARKMTDHGRANDSRAVVVFACMVAAAGIGAIEIREFTLVSERYHVIA